MENIRLYPFGPLDGYWDGVVFRQAVRAHKGGRGCVEGSWQEQEGNGTLSKR